MSKISQQIKSAPLRFCERCCGIARIATIEVVGAIGKFRFQCDSHARQARHAQQLGRNIAVRERAMLAETPLCYL